MNMPLVLAKIDETYKIIRLHGNDSLHNRLEELGFVVGAEVKVISNNNGNIIVEIKGSRIAIDRTLSTKIDIN